MLHRKVNQRIITYDKLKEVDRVVKKWYHPASSYCKVINYQGSLGANDLPLLLILVHQTFQTQPRHFLIVKKWKMLWSNCMREKIIEME